MILHECLVRKISPSVPERDLLQAGWQVSILQAGWQVSVLQAGWQVSVLQAGWQVSLSAEVSFIGAVALVCRLLAITTASGLSPAHAVTFLLFGGPLCLFLSVVSCVPLGL
jgi:hypothetical protein